MSQLATDVRRVTGSSIPELIGHTPLVRLPRFEPTTGVEIYAKLEMYNPGGSVKDRAALAMVLEGERTGRLGRGKILLDATSGNTGIAYAMLGAARGHRVRLCVPTNVTPERKRLLRVYGADLVLTDPMDGSDGAIRQVRAIYERDPHRYYYPDQYSNPANWRAHFDTTGVEILEQTHGRVTHFVAGLGTSGTFMGTGRRLKQDRPGVTLVSVQPDSPFHGLEGLKHMASALVPAIYDPALADIDARVSTDEAHELTRRLAHEQGLFVGPSSGAALAAARQIAGTITEGVIVAMFPDGGDRYLSDALWDVRDEEAADEEAPVHLSITDAEMTAIRRHAARILSGRVLRRAARPQARHGDRGLSTRQHVPGRAAAAVPRGPRRVPACGGARGRDRPLAAGFLSLPSRSSGRALAVRSRSRLAEPELSDRLGSPGPGQGGPLVAPQGRPVRVRRGVRLLTR